MASFSRKGATEQVETSAPQQEETQAVEVQRPAPVTAPHAAFPRVNLIPDEIAYEARVRTAKLILGGTVAASFIVVGGLYLMAAGEVSSAQDQLSTNQARSAALATESAKYADVPKVRAELASAQGQQAAAMGGEVRWSIVLNNLAITMPQGTSLTTLTGTITGMAESAPGAAAAATPGSTVTSVLGQPGVGSLQFVGEALDEGRVANFLEAIAKNKGLIDPFATSAAKKGVSTEAGAEPSLKGVNYTASATISPKALSHRYDVKGD